MRNQASPELRELGLETCDAARLATGMSIKNHGGRRDVLRISSGHARDYYLKRMWRTPLKNSAISLMRHGVIRSLAQEEFENYGRLRAAGISTARPIGFGEEMGAIAEKFSYIVTEVAPGDALDTFLTSNSHQDGRREVLFAAGRFVRRMHDSGFAFPDLFARHLFVSQNDSGPTFSLIDVVRLDEAADIGDRLRARDLAALHASVPLGVSAERERVIFLDGYGRRDHPALADGIRARMKQLLRRKKFSAWASSSSLGAQPT